MNFDFLLITSTNTDPVMHLTPRTSFRGIEDVEYIPKFGYRNLLNRNFFFILLFKKIPKGIQI